MEQSKDKVYQNSGNADVLRHITLPEATILDVGCGGGSLAKILRGIGHTIDGITISEEERASARPFCREVFIYNLENGLPENVLYNEYDYIVCSHVLEHIVYPGKLLRDARKILKPGGRLIVALPNLMHYKSRMKLLTGDFNYQQAGIWDYTHVKWYTFSSAQKLLAHANFKIETAEVTGELPLNSLFSKILPAAARKKIYAALAGISKGFFGYQLLFTASIADGK